MIIIGDVKTRKLAAVFFDPAKNVLPAVTIGKTFRQRFKRPASLPGQLAPNTHIITTVIVNIDAAEKLFAFVPSCTSAFDPRNILHTDCFDDLTDAVVFRCKAQVIVNNNVL